MMLWRSVSQAAVLLSVFIAFILILLLLHPARPLIGGYRGGNAASVHFRDGMHNVNITNPSHFFVNRGSSYLRENYARNNCLLYVFLHIVGCVFFSHHGHVVTIHLRK